MTTVYGARLAGRSTNGLPPADYLHDSRLCSHHSNYRGGAMTHVDFLGPHGGEMAMAFAAGCVATWVFMKVLYDQRIIEIKATMALQKEQCDRDRLDSAKSEALLWDRIKQLETILLATGNQKMQAEMQRMKPGEG